MGWDSENYMYMYENRCVALGGDVQRREFLQSPLAARNHGAAPWRHGARGQILRKFKKVSTGSS